METILTDTIDNGTIESVQIAPIGSFVGSDAKGNPVTENITTESLKRLADGLNASGEEILLDVDHSSCKAGVEKDTSACGWFSKFVVDPLKGLFATLKLTKKGKEIIENREYRYTSPVFQLDENGEPSNLHSVAVTNLPAFKGNIKPILNTQSTFENDLTKETINMEMTKEELINLIKETFNSCSSEIKKEEIKETEEETEEIKNEEPKKEETKTEETKTEETKVEEPKTEETKETEEEKKEEPKTEETKETEEEKKEEPKTEEKKEEVIKIEALNTAPTPTLSETEPWKKLEGKAFIDYINSGAYRK